MSLRGSEEPVHSLSPEELCSSPILPLCLMLLVSSGKALRLFAPSKPIWQLRIGIHVETRERLWSRGGREHARLAETFNINQMKTSCWLCISLRCRTEWWAFHSEERLHLPGWIPDGRRSSLVLILQLLTWWFFSWSRPNPKINKPKQA